MAVNVDHAIPITQKPTENIFEERIPIQNVMLEAVNRIDYRIARGVQSLPPLRAKGVLCTIDDMSDMIDSCKDGSQPFSWTHENARAKPRRWLSNVVWGVHYRIVKVQ
jgi:hypothetical protein